jgi:hypothetical protein
MGVGARILAGLVGLKRYAAREVYRSLVPDACDALGTPVAA